MAAQWPIAPRTGGDRMHGRPLGPTRATCYLVAAMALVGANVAFGKTLAREVPIHAFLVFRFLVSSLVLWVLARGEAGPRLASMTGAELRQLVAMAALGMVGFTVLMLEGVKRTAAADAGIITATLPAVLALMGVLALGERMTPARAGAVLLAMSGLMLVQAGGGAGGSHSLAGNLLVGGAVLCEASFVILAKRLAERFQPFRLALGANLAGLVLSLPLLALDWGQLDITRFSPQLWALAIWYVLAASVISLWFWYRGLPHVETWRAGVATAALPVAALAVSALALGETLGPARLAGAALVIAGIVAAALSAGERRG